MTKFEVIRKIFGIQEFSSLVFDLAWRSKTEDEFMKFLSEELTEEGLQTIRSVAQSGNYPLSLDGMQ